MDEKEEVLRARRNRDRDDLNNENAGRDIGRIYRFTTVNETPQAREARQRSERLSDSIRALTHEERIQRLSERLRDLDHAARLTLERAERDLASVQARAAVDESGRHMYQTEDGRTAFYEDDTEVPREIQDRMDWAGRPKHGEFRQQRNTRDEASANVTAIERITERIRRGEPVTDSDIDAIEQSLTQRETESPAASNIQPVDRTTREQRNDEIWRAINNGELSSEDAANLLDGHPSPATAHQPPRTSAAAEYQGGAFSDAPNPTQSFNQAGSGKPVTEQAQNDRAPPQPTEAPRGP